MNIVREPKHYKSIDNELLRQFLQKQHVGEAIDSADIPLTSFRPERVLFPPGGVSLRLCLCGVPQ